VEFFMEIPFTKAQAVGNDFLIVEETALTAAGIGEDGLPEFSRRFCDRHLGVGGDGVEILAEPRVTEADAFIRLFNSDGSEAEISGNGTRCVAAYLLSQGRPSPLRIGTQAGVKQLKLVERRGELYQLEMAMGEPRYRNEEIRCALQTSRGEHEVTLLDVGNPQCVLLVDNFDFDWRALGREIEQHPRFPNRTNVSFVRAADRHTIEVRFWERGAGETHSSGTGATGATVAAILWGRAESPVVVLTPAGEMKLRWEKTVLLEGPAEIVARGHYLGS
jgi:diaminopimelate epimerase